MIRVKPTKKPRRWELPIPDFDEPPSGLVPVGDTGLYATPTEPADPEDCERYPDSIFCGGIPLSLKPIDLGVSIVVDECNIGIQAEPVIGFIKLPPVAIVYRKPECRLTKLPKEVTNTDGLDLPDSFDGKFAFITIPKRVYFKIPRLNQNQEIVYAEGIQECELLNVNMNARNGEWVSITVQWTIKGNYSKTFFGGENSQIRVNQTDLITYNIDDYKNTATITKQLEAHDTYYTEALEGIETGYAEKVDFLDFSGRGAVEVAQHYIRDPNKDYYMNDSYLFELLDNYSVGGIAVNPRGLLLEPNRQAIIDRYSKRSLVREVNLDLANSDTGEPLFYSFGTPYHSYRVNPPITATEIYEQEWQVIFAPYNDVLAPPPPKEPCCMACCPPPDNALLKLLLKKVEKLSEIVGVEEFPAKAPKRLTYPNGKGDVEIKNLVEFLGYQVKQIDRAVGLLPQKIKVADTNPGLAGNQSVEIEIHSFADFAREMLQYLLDTEGDVDTTNNMLVRVLYELGFIHQGVVQGDAMLDAVCEHLDFKQRWKKISVPFAFDPHAGTKGQVGQGFDKQKNNAGKGAQTEEDVEKLLPKLLQNTEVDVRVLVNDEKKSLNDQMIDLKRDTALAAAALSEPVGSNRLDQLVAAAQLLIQLQGAVDRKNLRQALTGGDLKTTQKDGGG